MDKALYYLKSSFEKDSSNKWIIYKIVLLLEKKGNDMVAIGARRGLRLFPDFIELALLAGNLSFRHQLYSRQSIFIPRQRIRALRRHSRA